MNNINLNSKELLNESKYWSEKLSKGLELSSFPKETKTDESFEKTNSILLYKIDNEISESVLRMGNGQGYAVYVILLSTINYILARYNSCEDILLGMPCLKGEEDDEEFLNVLILRSFVDEDKSFKEFLLEIRNTVREADSNSNFPICKALEILNEDKVDIAYVPTMILLRQIHNSEILKEIHSDMVFTFDIEESNIELCINYDGNKYPTWMVEKICKHLNRVLGIVTKNPSVLLKEIEILDKEEIYEQLYTFNDTMASYPSDMTISKIFERQVEKTPYNTAVCFGDEEITYIELNDKVTQLALLLRERGVTRDYIVGVMMDKSIEMIVSLLAVLKAGGAYLPIEPDLPRERVLYMLNDSKAKYLIINDSSYLDEDLLCNLNDNITVFNLSDKALLHYDRDINDKSILDINTPSDLAYIIYTSGTTGQPKAAMIEHRNLIRLLFNEKNLFNFTQDDVWTMFHSFCFDFSVWEMYGALLYGGKLVIVPKSIAREPLEFLEILKQQKVTVLNQTPTAFMGLSTAIAFETKELGLALRYVVFGGEALKPAILKEWKNRCPSTKFINMYGITETTVHVTYKEITDLEIQKNISNIGKPILTLTTYIMDAKQRLLPIGAVGELCVGGDGVGRGYLNNPELTATKFIENPYKKNERLYLSGDHARLLPNGEMEYFGRIDGQIKIRGHRVELGEIEAALLSINGIKEATTDLKKDKNGDSSIVAYIVVQEDFDISGLKLVLGNKLPSYMIPSYFMKLSKLPMNKNNKIDKRNLPLPDEQLDSVEIEPCRNNIDKALVSIFENLLNIKKVGINSNFFNSGGDSMKAISLVSKINRELNTNIQVRDIYLNPTIKGLSDSLLNKDFDGLQKLLKDGNDEIEKIKNVILKDDAAKIKLPTDFEDFYPLSAIQKGMVFFTKIRPDEPIYHDQFPYFIKLENFNGNILNEAMNILINRHPILRTSFIADEFIEPVQVVHKSNSGFLPRINVIDLTAHEIEMQQKEIYEYMEHDLLKRFSFNNDPLWRMALFNLGDDKYCIIFSFQHAILDGWSVASLTTELFYLIKCIVNGEKIVLPDIKATYKDYVSLSLSKKVSNEVRSYWKDTLCGYKKTKLPFNISSKKINNVKGIKIKKGVLDNNLFIALKAKAKDFECTVKDLCTCAHFYLLGITSTDTDIISGVVTHERPAIYDSEKVLGCFLNTIPLRIKLKENIGKIELLNIVKDSYRIAKANELFLGDIASIIKDNDRSGNPIFETLFNFTDFHVLKSIDDNENLYDLENMPQISSNEMTNTLLDLEISNTLDTFYMQIKYSPNYFYDEDIEIAFSLYIDILKEFAYGKEAYLDPSKLVSKSDFNKRVFEYNNTKTQYDKEQTLKGLFEGYSRNKLPFNISNNKVSNKTGSAVLKMNLAGSLLNSLEEEAKTYQCTLKDICLAAHIYLLGILSTETDVVTGVVTHDRHVMEDSENILGCFPNTIPIRVSTENRIGKLELIERVRDSYCKIKSTELFLSDIADIIGESGVNGNPIFDTLFNFIDLHVLKSVPDIGGVEQADSGIKTFTNEMTTTFFDLEISKILDAFSMQIKYSMKYFYPEEIETAADLYVRILEVFANQDCDELSLEDVINPLQLKEMVYDFNNTELPYAKEKTMYSLFEEQVVKNSGNIAVVVDDRQMTYRELNEKANRLARYLIDKGVKNGDLVGLVVQRDFEMIVGMFAILKCGGAYVPIDPAYPAARQEYILRNSNVSAVLVDCDYEIDSLNIIKISSDEVEAYSNENLDIKKDSRDLAYVIYTSGSTGMPKGVMIEHHSAVNLISWVNREFNVSKKDSFLFITSMCFDLSVYDIFGILAAGGKVVIAKKEQVQEPDELKMLLLKHKITFWDSVPSTMNYLVSTLEDKDNAYLQENLRLVFMSGDWIPVQLPDKLVNFFPNARVISLGGATEGTIWSIYYPVKGNEGSMKSIPYGKPMDNNTFYILDNERKPLPKGVAGELYIGGVGVARGYINRPDLTNERFVPDPFYKGNMIESPMMYRTGDLGRFLPDGNIEFLGRMDYQVKIRGYRVELGEIENKLLCHELVKDAVVVDKTDSSGNKYLCAYIVWEKECTVAEMRSFLSAELPEYMIPTYFVGIEKIPLNSNGKIDRKALPEPGENICTGKGYLPAETETEEKLSAIWRDVLEMDQISVEDNFFELGGHSLKATAVTSRVNKVFNVELPLVEFFRTPTIRELSAYIDNASESRHKTIKPSEKREFYPVSSAQRRIYIIDRIDNSKAVYNIPGVLVIEGDFDKNHFESVIMKLAARHEAFRTQFEIVDGEPVQRIVGNVDIPISYIEGLECDVETEIFKFLRPFDLSKAPLLRVGVMRINSQKHVFMFDMHHIISDGTSMGILINEFISLYNGEALADVSLRYRDFSEWQNRIIKNGELKKQEEYWLEKYSGEIPVLNLPLDYQRPAIQNFEGAAVSFEVGPELLAKLKKAAGSGKTVFMELLAAYSILLSMYSGQDDIVIGSTIAGRHHADLQNIIGMFVNTLAIRNKPSGDKTIAQFMDEVKENALEAYENQDYQFEELVSRLNLERDLSRNPLFSAMLTMQNADFKGREINGLKFKPFSMERKTAKFDLLLEAMEVEDRIEFTLEYATSLFKRETIEQMTQYFIRILDAVASDSGAKIKDIDLLSSSEKEAVVSNVNIAGNGERYKTIHEMFEEQVIKTPDKTALEYDNKKYTYLELNEKANRLAWFLREKGLNPGQPAGIIAKRSFEFVTAVLAVLKAGGYILPIDPEYPEERIQYMLEDSGTGILLTQGILKEGVDFNGQILNLENADIFTGSSSNPENLNNPKDLLYIIYTSGTTGKPKGVMIEHRNMANLMDFQYSKTNIDFSKKVLQFATVSFDVCYQEIFGALLSGGELIIAGEEEKKDAEKLFKFIEERDIKVIFLPTAFLKFILNEKKYVEMLPRSIEHIITAGEQLIVNGELKSFMKSNGVYLHNHYGPSETHVVTTYTMGPEDVIPDIPPIGKPISNVGIYILGKNGRMQPAGIPGEIYITGAGTGRGYINLPDLTAEKFLDDPYVVGSRMYRTGDLARRLPDGNIEFLGRADDQVKVRGYRIELGEIETQLLKHPLVKEAIVIVKKDRNGEKYLCAYIATEEEVNVADIRGYLQKGLPDFMIPSRFISLPKMPLMKNGKVDRQALLKFNDTIDLGAEYVAPRNKREWDLAEIWSNLLEVDKVGVYDEFFLLGGDSLKALKAANEAKLKGLEISIADIFRYKTIAEIIENTSAVDLEVVTPIIPEEEKQEVYKTENCWHPSSMYVKNEEHVKELKIELQREVTLNGHRALPLCMILTDPKLHTWYFQHYTNIFSVIDNNDYITLEYLETWAPYRDVINEISLGAPLLEKETDIIGFITDKISRGYYLHVAIDEYYIPGKARYKKTHYLHHTLVYGYNNIERQFNVIEYDIGGVLNKHIFSYDSVSKAYEKGKEHYNEPASSWAYESAVQIFYMNRFECEHPFRLKRFAHDIKNYLYSKGDDSIVYYWKMSKERINYGFAVHDVVIRALHGFVEGKFLTDYRAVHMLSEHKKGIATRLNFIMNRFELHDILLEKYEEYLKVVEEFNNIRLKFFDLQYNISQERIEKSKLKLKVEIENLIQAINSAKKREWSVLKEIYEILISIADESQD